MAISRKRKAAAAVESAPAPKHTRSTKMQKSINAFGSVGKPHERDLDCKKRKTAHQRESTPPPPPLPATKVVVKADKKRKRSANISDDEDEIAVCPRNIAPKDARESEDAILSTPRNKRVKNVFPSPAETPTRGAAALFDRLDIAANSRSIPIALGGPLNAYNTPPESPNSKDKGADLSILADLADLRHLYSSFLAALSMHYSHNGTSSPVDVKALLEIVTQHYKKRAVKLEDLQRVLTIASRLDQSFKLENYGRAGVRLTRAEPRGRTQKQASSYVDEAKLNARFGDALRQSWQSWEACTAKENRNSAAFLSHLPLLPITKNASAEKAAPLFARGEQRLADLKASQIAAVNAQPAKPTPEEAVAQRSATQNRGTALLDRILAKQSLSSTLPAGPTKSQLERKSALHRIEEITRIISLLASSKERCSFSMQIVTQQLQQSLRNPISREEVERCLDLMSREIVPNFIKVVQSGEVKAVTITKNGSISLAELRERVERACV